MDPNRNNNEYGVKVINSSTDGREIIVFADTPEQAEGHFRGGARFDLVISHLGL